MISSNEKRVYKNTIVLTLRTALTIPIGFFSVRLALNLLGAADYGMVNVLSGLTSLAGVLTQCISGAARRFLCYDIAAEDQERTRKLFSLLRLHYWSSAVFLALLAEAFGYWMICYKINMPAENVKLALLFYQTVVANFLFGYLGGSYSNLLAAYEEMAILAWISLGESILNICLLGILFLIKDGKMVIPYGIASSLVVFSAATAYWFVARMKFREVVRFVWYWDKKLVREIFNFASWQFLAGVSSCFYRIINDVLLNNYFSSVMNAAQGIANIVNGKIASFGFCFMTASGPQLIKLYAQGKIDEMEALFLRMTKFSMFVLLILGLPIFANIEFVLKIWLKEPPAYSASFVMLGYLLALVDITCVPGNTVLDATGKIRGIQIVRATMSWLILLVAYVGLVKGAGPLWIPVSAIISSVSMFFVRFAFIKRLIPQFRIRRFMAGLFMGTVPVLILVSVLAFGSRWWLSADTWLSVVVRTTVVTLGGAFVIGAFGLSKGEREFARQAILQRLHGRC